MKAFKDFFRLVRDRSGATMIEYALIGGIICVAVVAGASALGSSANGAYTRVSDGVWGASAPPP